MSKVLGQDVNVRSVFDYVENTGLAICGAITGFDLMSL